MKNLLYSFVLCFSMSHLFGQQTAWTVYTNSNSGLTSDLIETIAIDNNGDKWIGTYFGGVSRFDGNNWTGYLTWNSGLPYDLIYSIGVDNNGDKWIATFGGGVARFDGSNWSVYNTLNFGLPDSNVTTITIDSNGDKWIGTYNGGIGKFDGTNWVVYDNQNSGLQDNFVRSIAIDNNGEKWIGTFSGGVYRFDGTNWTAYFTQNSGLPSNNVKSIAIDNNGDKWFGTLGSGLTRFDGTNWTVYNTQNSGLPNDDVFSITIDNNGDKWIGTFGGGIARFDGTNWTVYNTQNSGLPNDDVYSIAIDNNGDKWIGTWAGVALMQLCPPAPGIITISPSTLNNACPLSTPTLLTANGSATHWIWSDGSTSPTLATPTAPGTYAISVMGYSGPPLWCTSSGSTSNTLSFQVYNLPANDILCLATVDTLTGKNQLIWNKSAGMRTDSFRIYKETNQSGVYNFAANQAYGAFSTWTDLNSNPVQQSYRYYLSVLDSCGAESSTLNSPTIHRTIHLSCNQGINGENNLTWSQYEGITFSTYNIWRKNNGNPYIQIGSVPSTNLTFSDLVPPTGTNQYIIEVVLPVGCSPSSKTGSNRGSFSNAVLQSSSIGNSQEERLQFLTRVYPNPANMQLNIILPEKVILENLSFKDMQGKNLIIPWTFRQNEINADLSGLPAGMWVVLIQTNKGPVYKTFAKQ